MSIVTGSNHLCRVGVKRRDPDNWTIWQETIIIRRLPGKRMSRMDQRIMRVGFIGLGRMGKPMAIILHESALLLFLLFARLQEGLAETVKIAIPSTTQAVLPFTIARDKGYYRAEGLDVELVLISAPIASRALLSGAVTVATVGGAGLPPVLRGSPFKFLFTTYNRAMFWLYAKPEIRDGKALKGKRVGVSCIGSGPDSLVSEVF